METIDTYTATRQETYRSLSSILRKSMAAGTKDLCLDLLVPMFVGSSGDAGKMDGALPILCVLYNWERSDAFMLVTLTCSSTCFPVLQVALAPPPPQPGLPSSLTLLSLSSLSDCNSTRSLLRSDSEELLSCRPASSSAAAAARAQAPPSSVSQPPPAFQPRLNPLVNTHLESFKRNPRQSLTPTHLPSAATSAARCLRRTPSDGAIKKNLQPLPEKSPWESTGTRR